MGVFRAFFPDFSYEIGQKRQNSVGKIFGVGGGGEGPEIGRKLGSRCTVSFMRLMMVKPTCASCLGDASASAQLPITICYLGQQKPALKRHKMIHHHVHSSPIISPRWFSPPLRCLRLLLITFFFSLFDALAPSSSH